MGNIASWKRLMVYLRPYRFWAVLAFIGIVGNTTLMVAIPTILGDVIDIGIVRNDSNYMLAAGLLIVGLGLLRGLTGFMFRYFGEKLSHFIAYDIRNQVYNHVQNLSFIYHDKAETGTLITRAISDVDEIQRYFAFGLIDGLNTLLLTTIITLVMILNSPVLAAIALAPLIPLAYLSRNFAMSVDPKWKKIMERMQKLGNHIQENALGAEVVRAFNREDYELAKFRADNDELYNERISLFQSWSNFIPVSSIIIAISTALILIVGGIMERDSIAGVTVGLIVSFNAYILLLSQPIRFLGFVILLTTQAVSSAGRVFEILDTPMAIQNKPDAIKLPQIEGHVEFENVCFAYEKDTMEILHDVSFEARPGQVVAVIGPTGSGKSSLMNLIPRFYDITGGAIRVDGYDVRDVDVNDLRSHIGVVLQESLLFSATIRENIAYGRPDAAEDEIIAAAEAANAHEFITGFPNGYDTEIGERGVTLSGGQRQRVAIARALLINPRILILDDATSSVDTKTEHLIQEALDRLMEGRTTFIIAQRLNSVQKADLILVLENGKITERGTHDSLLSLGGHYAEIYELQLADQERVRLELETLKRKRQEYADRRLATDEYRAIMERVGRSGD